MTWIPWQRQFDVGYSSPELWPATNGEPEGGAPTATEEWLVEAIYQTMVAESRCGECRSRLGRRLQIRPVEGHPASAWTLTVEASCRGWRRHRHTAVVVDTGSHLELGPFVVSVAQ
jgi:hypothetical protein